MARPLKYPLTLQETAALLIHNGFAPLWYSHPIFGEPCTPDDWGSQYAPFLGLAAPCHTPQEGDHTLLALAGGVKIRRTIFGRLVVEGAK